MKKLFILATFFIIGSSAHSQFSFGAKAGVSLGTGNAFGQGVRVKRTTGFAGGYINYRFKSKMALQMEAMYSNEGMAPIPEYSPVKRKIRSGRVRVPLMLQWKLPENWFTEAGIQFRSTVSVIQMPNGKTNLDLQSIYRSGNWGFVFGGGYKCRGKWSGMKLGVRYNIELPRGGGNGTKNTKRTINISLSCPIRKR